MSEHRPSWGGLQVCIPQPGTQKTRSPHNTFLGTSTGACTHPPHHRHGPHPAVHFTPNPQHQAQKKEEVQGCTAR